MTELAIPGDPDCFHVWGPDSFFAGVALAGCVRCSAVIERPAAPDDLHDHDAVERWLAE